MINIAIYKKKDYKELLEIKSSHNITYFCNDIDKNSVKLKYKDNNALNEIKNYFKNQPFLLLFNDEKISTEIPDALSLKMTDGTNYKRSFYGTNSWMQCLFGLNAAESVVKHLLKD